MQKLQLSTFATLVGLAVAGILLLGIPLEAEAKHKKTLVLEVAQDGTTLGANPADPPGRANLAVINGNIYPGGSPLDKDGNFDAKPIGTWRCVFTGLGSIDDPLVGAVTYYFSFGETGEGPDRDLEKSMLIVQGLNTHAPPDTNPPARVHAIVGGTGKFNKARGQVVEIVTGGNPVGLNLRFIFKLNKRVW